MWVYVAAYILVGILITVAGMKFNSSFCREYYSGPVSECSMGLSILLWPMSVVAVVCWFFMRVICTLFKL